MATARLQTLAALDSARLTEIMRRVQVSPSFKIGPWDVRLLSSDGMINPEGLFLFSGDGHDQRGRRPWSVVLKVLQSRTPEPDPSDPWHWKREYWAMECGLLDRTTGACLPSGTKFDYPWLYQWLAQTWSEGWEPNEDVWVNKYVHRVWSEA